MFGSETIFSGNITCVHEANSVKHILIFSFFRAAMKKWFGNSAVLPLGLLETTFNGPEKSPSSKINMYTAENATATKEFVMNVLDDFLGELKGDL